MKQHLAKSLLMTGALIASYPLLAQQVAPVQQAQPMTATQAAPVAPAASAGYAPAAPAGYAAPSATSAPAAPVDVAQQQPAANPYAQGSMETVQMGVPPAPGSATMAPAPAAVDPASMSLPPDALGSRLGRRNIYLDGA
ncbi:hypothetical protein [Cupriavidus sp. D384]|uniref:hypothetical protein n=1 Tax=Cupriavidus sp. D384 TaxID=1538095 RepID=UPI00082D63A4|nr:hypothetical protein [Cupriavidus sp. D384]